MKPEQTLRRLEIIVTVLAITSVVLLFMVYQFEWIGFALMLAPLIIMVVILAIYSFILTRRFSRVREKHEAVVEKNNIRLLTLVNSLGEAIFAVDKHGKITIYNAAALELIDSHEDIYGKPIDSILRLTNVKNEPQSSIREVFEHGKVILRDDLVLKTKQKNIEVYLTITPIKEMGELAGAIILARDISKQKGLEQQKDEFLSVVSHELRTPVAVVEADLSTVLLPGYAKLPPKATKLLRSASQNLTYLSGLLQDISDLSHSERSILDTELVSFTAQKLAAELNDDFSNQAKKSKLQIKLEAPDQPISLVSSYQRVREILVNFLTNAIKYSANHGRTITLQVMPSRHFPGGACFVVSDQGIGMNPADVRRLFKKFFRSADDRVQQIRGTGMGLYIAHKQAEKIGARISVQSHPNHGTSFSLDVPASIKAQSGTSEK